MGLKTNELQQLEAVLGTDSLLADTAAAGTGRVPIAKLAEFLANGDNAVKAALLNKAEAGYGLGTDCRDVASFESITKDGWYTAIDSDCPDKAGWWIGIYSINNTMGNLLAFRDGYIAQKKRYRSEWGPWEWVNPPMSVGVEYRTVERYMGKPVYVKLVDCGEMPSAKSEKVVHACAENTVQIIRCHGIINSGDSLPGVYGYLGGSVSKNTLNFRGSTLYIRVVLLRIQIPVFNQSCR